MLLSFLSNNDLNVSGGDQQPSNPIRRTFQVAALAAGMFFVPTDDKADWQQPTSQPQQKVATRQNVGEFRTDVVASAENITVDKWYQQLSEPVRRKTYVITGGEFRTDLVTPAEVITVDKWYQPFSEPVRRKLSQTQSGEVRTDLIIPVDSWNRVTEQPYIIKRRTIITDSGVPSEVITVDKWIGQYPDYVFRTRRNDNSGETRVDVVVTEIVTLDKWYKEIVQPYFARKTDANTGEVQVIDPDLFPPPPPPEQPNVATLEETDGGHVQGTVPSLIDLRKEDDEIIEIIKAITECL